MLSNWGAGEGSWESLRQQDQTCQSQRKSDLNFHWRDWCGSWSSNTLVTWYEELTQWKRHDAGKDWRQEEKGMTEDETVGWCHWLDGHEFEPTLGDGEGQGSLVCCRQWDHKESDTILQLNKNKGFSGEHGPALGIFHRVGKLTLIFFKSQNKYTVTNCVKYLGGKLQSSKIAHVRVGWGSNLPEVRKKTFLKNWHLSSNMKTKKLLNRLTAGLLRAFKELKCSGNNHNSSPIPYFLSCLELGLFLPRAGWGTNTPSPRVQSMLSPPTCVVWPPCIPTVFPPALWLERLSSSHTLRHLQRRLLTSSARLSAPLPTHTHSLWLPHSYPAAPGPRGSRENTSLGVEKAAAGWRKVRRTQLRCESQVRGL